MGFDLTNHALFMPDDDMSELDTFATTSDSSDGIPGKAAQLVFASPLAYSHNESSDFDDLMKGLVSVSSAGPPSLHISTSRTTTRGCQCMSSMVQLLEDIGFQRTTPEATGIDGFLKCLHTGTHACSNVLMCTQCSLFSESSMLLATVVQQLGDICCDMANLLTTQERASGGSRDSQPGNDGALEGAIWFGRYSIEMPKMRDTLVHNLIMLHLSDLQSLLTRLKGKIGRKRGAWRLVTEAEEKFDKVHRVVQTLGISGMNQRPHHAIS